MMNHHLITVLCSLQWPSRFPGSDRHNLKVYMLSETLGRPRIEDSPMGKIRIGIAGKENNLKSIQMLPNYFFDASNNRSHYEVQGSCRSPP